MSQNIILMARREDPFARVPKTTLDDDRLSWRAKGVLSYLLGKPSGWKVRKSDLQKHSTDGDTAIRSALKELRATGYAKLEKSCYGNGRVAEWIWKVSDSPIFTPDVGNQHVVNQPISKKEYSKNKSKESEGTSPAADVVFPSEWKPSQKSKDDQLKRTRPPKRYPSQDEFNSFLSVGQLEDVANYRPDLYRELCVNKWHHWKASSNRWFPIRDWKKFVSALDRKMQEARQ